MKNQLCSLVVAFFVATCFASTEDSSYVDRIGHPGGSAIKIEIVGSTAYVADGYGLRVLDIYDPSAPSQLGFAEISSGGAVDVAVQGNYAFVVDHHFGYRVFDISNPENPSLIGGSNIPAHSYGVTVDSSNVYVVDHLNGLWIFDNNNPSSPTFVGMCNAPGSTLVVNDNIAYLADRASGLRIVDVDDPSSPHEIGYVDTGGAFGISLAGQYAYVVGWTSGLDVIDVSTPDAPFLVAHLNLLGTPTDVCVSGGYAYITELNWEGDEHGGLRVFDISNPYSPLEVGYHYIPGWSQGVTVRGNHAYVANDRQGVRIFDISMPASPVQTGWYIYQCNTCDSPIDISDDTYDGVHYFYDHSANTCCATRVFACASEYGCGQGICRVSGPSIVYRLGVRLETHLAITVYSDEGSDTQLQVFTDCTDPASSCIYSQDSAVPSDAPEYVSGLTLSPGTYYISNSLRGTDNCGSIHMSMVADHRLPVELLSFNTVALDGKIRLEWQTASETNNDHFEIEREETVVAFVLAASSASGSTYDWIDSGLTNGQTYVYSLISVSDDGSREVIGHCSAVPKINESIIGEYALHQNFPNPFNPQTTIMFDMLDQGRVELSVRDTNGRIVAKLVNGTLSAGRHTTVINASHLPSGLYFYELKVGDFHAVRKMILLR